MSNSPLVRYAKMSPNHSGKRTHAIDRITPHCVVLQCDVGALGELFSKASRQASSNYGIGADGQIGMFVEECNRSWCSSNEANDQRAVTIECASDATEPDAMRDAVYQSLIYLCADICRRNGKTKLLWLGDKEKTLGYTPNRTRWYSPSTDGLRTSPVRGTGFTAGSMIWRKRSRSCLPTRRWTTLPRTGQRMR